MHLLQCFYEVLKLVWTKQCKYFKIEMQFSKHMCKWCVSTSLKSVIHSVCTCQNLKNTDDVIYGRALRSTKGLFQEDHQLTPPSEVCWPNVCDASSLTQCESIPRVPRSIKYKWRHSSAKVWSGNLSDHYAMSVKIVFTEKMITVSGCFFTN